MTYEDLTDQKFNRLTVLKMVGINRHKRSLWLCECDCGNKHVVVSHKLKSNSIKSCGCWNIEAIILRNTKHGFAGTKVYDRWYAMMDRCYNPRNPYYKDYGGRGIIVVERWHDVKNFAADMGDPPEGLSLERIDNKGDYELGNCKWATPIEQSRNTRFNRRYMLNGENLCFSEILLRFRIHRNTVDRRLGAGWTLIEALTTPPRKERGNYATEAIDIVAIFDNKG